MNGLVLDEGGISPWDVVTLMPSGAWAEKENGSPEKGAHNGLLERGDDAGVNGSVHELIFDGVETLGEDVVVLSETHIPHHRTRCLVRLSGR